MDIIEATQDVEGLTYLPRAAETRQLCHTPRTWGPISGYHLKRSGHRIGVSKNEAVKDFDKKRDIEDVLGLVSGDQFSQLVVLSKKITDLQCRGRGP